MTTVQHELSVHNCPLCAREQRNQTVERWWEAKGHVPQHFLLEHLRQFEEAAATWIRQSTTFSDWEEHVLKYFFVLKRLGVSDEDARDEIVELNRELLEQSESEAFERHLAFVNAERDVDPDATTTKCAAPNPTDGRSSRRRPDAGRTGSQSERGQAR